MTSLNDWFNNSPGWIIAVLIVGVVTTIATMFGYVQVALGPCIAALWMILVFPAAATVVLPEMEVKSI